MRPFRSAGRHVAAAFAAALLASSPAYAFETLKFRTPGASDEFRDVLRGASLLLTLRGEDVSDPQELLAAARSEYSRLIGALYAGGYYGSAISIKIDGREAAAIPPLETPGAIREIVIEIRPGPQYAFSKAEAAPLAEGTRLPDGFATGEPARTPVIRDAANAAVSRWRSAGHAKAQVSGQSIVADHRSRTVGADLTLDPGPRLRFGDLVIRGEERMRTERVREIAGLPTGQVFDPEEIDKSLGRLRRSGVFRSVSATEAETPNADDTLDILLRVAEERPRRYGVGLEFSTVEGPSASAYWMHRNLFGGAERLRVEGQWSSIDESTGGMDYSLGVSLTRVATRGPDTDLYINLDLEQLNEPDFVSHSVSGEIGYTRIATERLSVGLGAGFRVSSIRDSGGTDEYRFLTLPMQATWDDRNNALNATKGIYAHGDLMPFYGIQGSASGARFLGDARTYYSFGEARSFTLAGRLQFGSVIGPGINDVPNDLLFYSGGGGTVRGQGYQTLGIDLGGGDSSGGRSFVGFSTEARVGVTDAIQAVGFVDWGYIGRNSVPDGDGGSHAGAGLGLRYNTGIGPIRFDVAVPVAGDTNGDDFHIYIGIGQAF